MGLDRKFGLRTSLCGWNRHVVVHHLRPDHSVVSEFSAGHLVGESDLLVTILSPYLESGDSLGLVRCGNRFRQISSGNFTQGHFLGSSVLSHMRNL